MLVSSSHTQMFIYYQNTIHLLAERSLRDQMLLERYIRYVLIQATLKAFLTQPYWCLGESNLSRPVLFYSLRHIYLMY